VRAGHVRALVRRLKAKVGTGQDKLAPRTVRHVFGILHGMFEDAVADELIASNPCAIKRGELPAKIDKDRVTTDAGVLTLDSVQGVSFIAE